MEMSSPYPIYSKLDPQTPESNKDYSMTAPLAKDGSNWPAKGRATKDIVDSIDVVATLVAGEDFSWDLAGTATHNGGSCQVGVSYDYMETQVVLASWIGGCPMKKPYTFKVPDIPGCDKCIFFWSWFNKTGNREMYQNAAVVSISGTATSFTGPQAFRMNTFGDGVCTVEEVVVVFPNPGDQVFFGEGFDASTPSNAPDCPDWDNTKTVTVTGSGGPTDAVPSGGASAGSGSSSTSSAAGSTETGATGADSDGGAGETGGAGSTKANSAPAAGATTGSTGAGNPGTGSSSSGSTDKEFAVFAVGAIALFVLGGVVVCLAHKRATSGSSGGRTFRRGDPESDDSSSSSSDDGYARRSRRKGRRRRRGRRYRDEETSSSD
ncbi:hypothetical protein JCM3770_005250 [Rhodotorula araucariae]